MIISFTFINSDIISKKNGLKLQKKRHTDINIVCFNYYLTFVSVPSQEEHHTL